MSRAEKNLAMAAYGLERAMLPLAGHFDSLLQAPRGSLLELSELNGGSILRQPVRLAVQRIRPTANPPKIDGKGTDWAIDGESRVFGPMVVGTKYLSRPDLLEGQVRSEDAPATARWCYDADYLYVQVRCPQEAVSDERNTDWPSHGGEGDVGAVMHRWWGTDGLQIQLAGLKAMQGAGNGARPAVSGGGGGGGGGGASGKILVLAFKPGGVLMTRVGQLKGAGPVEWGEGPTGIKYGISLEKAAGKVTGYLVEAAIPRKWFENSEVVEGAGGPAWRANILRHRASDLTSSSWSGPVVNDEDVAMMGLLLGAD